MGVGRGRLAGSDLKRPFWGVRFLGSATSIREHAASYSPRMPPLALFSHVTAAQLWDIPLPVRLQGALPLHVAVPDPQRAPEGRDVIGHRLQLRRPDLRRISGLCVTSLERTVLDLATLLDDEELLGAIHNILWRRRRPQMRATIPTITAALASTSARRGRTRFLELLPLASPRSDSNPETAFRLRFIRAGFPDPIPDKDVFDAQGRFLAMPDLQFPVFRMAFDYEGDHHRTDPGQWCKDLRRVPLLQDANWHHTRPSAADLADLATFSRGRGECFSREDGPREVRQSHLQCLAQAVIAALASGGNGRPLPAVDSDETGGASRPCRPPAGRRSRPAHRLCRCGTHPRAPQSRARTARTHRCA